MTINDFENLFMFAGGLGMFLFGVHSMSGAACRNVPESRCVSFWES